MKLFNLLLTLIVAVTGFQAVNSLAVRPNIQGPAPLFFGPDSYSSVMSLENAVKPSILSETPHKLSELSRSSRQLLQFNQATEEKPIVSKKTNHSLKLNKELRELIAKLSQSKSAVTKTKRALSKLEHHKSHHRHANRESRSIDAGQTRKPDLNLSHLKKTSRVSTSAISQNKEMLAMLNLLKKKLLHHKTVHPVAKRHQTELHEDVHKFIKTPHHDEKRTVKAYCELFFDIHHRKEEHHDRHQSKKERHRKEDHRDRHQSKKERHSKEDHHDRHHRKEHDQSLPDPLKEYADHHIHPYSY